MISGADAIPDGLDQEGFEGSDTGTADEWLSFCDSSFTSVVRVEDLGCIGIVVRFTQGGLEVAVPSGAATPGMPDAVAVEVSSEPGSYSGASGDFATVGFTETDWRLVGPSRAARGDTCGAHGVRAGSLSCSAQAILSTQRSCRVFCWKKSKFKEAGGEASSEAVHAQCASPPAPSRRSWPIVSRSSADDSLSSKRQEREHQGLCRACSVSRLPLSAVLQLAHGLELCLEAERTLGAPEARCTVRLPLLVSSH